MNRKFLKPRTSFELDRFKRNLSKNVNEKEKSEIKMDSEIEDISDYISKKLLNKVDTNLSPMV